MYALAASAAGVGVLALAQPAEAKIVYTKTHKVLQQMGDSVNIDLNHDGVRDFAVAIGCVGWDSCVPTLRAYKFSNWIMMTASGAVAALPSGAYIGKQEGGARPLKTFSWGYPMLACGSRHAGGPWLDVKDRYLGLRFQIKGKAHYGWARLNASAQPPYQIRATLTGYAYETVPGKGIIAGQTKGPDVITVQSGSLGSLALGRK